MSDWVEPHQSLPVLVSSLNSLAHQSRKLAHSTHILVDSGGILTETEETETEGTETPPELEAEFVGFRKTQDFGDFVTFSNSPSYL